MHHFTKVQHLLPGVFWVDNAVYLFIFLYPNFQFFKILLQFTFHRLDVVGARYDVGDLVQATVCR